MKMWAPDRAMIRDKKELLPVVERFKDIRVVVLGDLMLDHYIWGKVQRISQEAPVVVVEQTEDSKRLGGAGNVVRNLCSLGAKVSVCGVVGDDEAGRHIVSLLKELGVDAGGVFVDPERPTTVKTRVIAHAQQVVRVDNEKRTLIPAKIQESLANHFAEQLQSSNGCIISDYAKGAVCSPVFSRIEEGYRNKRLGLGTSPVLVDPKSPNFPLYTRATVIKPNRGEAEDASGMLIRSRADALAAGRILLQRWQTEMVLITLGEMGMALVSREDGVLKSAEVDTVAREVYDVSGAGDTASAAFVMSLAAKATPVQAAMIANIASGIVVREVGTVSVPFDELLQELI